MVRKQLIIALTGLLCLAFSQVKAQRDTLNVLFLGNSYTYFWNMPQTVEAISAQTDGVYIKARQSTAGGATWKQHWEGEKGLKSREMIESSKWDVVILQNHSTSTIDNPDQFAQYGAQFVELVRANGAQPLLYMTWARAYNPMMKDQISRGYDRLAKEQKVKAVPIGLIWQLALQMRPGLPLYDPDGSHPSPVGAYLTAIAFYSALSGKGTEALPARIKTVDRNGETLYLSIMSKENADFMQDVVDSYLKKYGE